MKGSFQIRDGNLVPVDQATVDLLAKYKDRHHFVLDLKAQRNPKYHARAFALLRVLFDMIDSDVQFNPWRKLLTIRAGYFTSIGKINIEGETSVAVTADSLDFENMDQDEFKECFQGLHQAWGDKYGETISYDQLMEWSEM